MKEFRATIELEIGGQGGSLVFKKFLPRRKEGVSVELEGFGVLIFFSYLPQHLNHLSTEFLRRQKDVKRFLNIGVKTIMLEVTTQIPNRLYHDLGKEKLNNGTEKFAEKLMGAILTVYTRIGDYARNELGQYWIEQSEYRTDSYDQFFLSTRTIWEYEGRRTYLQIGHNAPLIVTFDKDAANSYITKAAWTRLDEFILRGRSAATERQFISNSLKHLSRNRTRMAILEAVIALEHYVKANRCTNLAGLLKESDRTVIAKLFNKEFSLPMELVLNRLEDSLGVSEVPKALILEAIQSRNQIMHSAQKEVDKKKARKLIFAIRNFIDLIRSKGA